MVKGMITNFDTYRIPKAVTKKIDKLIEDSSGEFSSRTEVLKWAFKEFKEKFYENINKEEPVPVEPRADGYHGFNFLDIYDSKLNKRLVVIA